MRLDPVVVGNAHPTMRFMSSKSEQRATGRQMVIPARLDELSRLREFVRSFANETGGDDDLAGDLALAVSELATNTIQHSADDSVEVRIAAAGDTRRTWTVDVSGADDDVVLPSGTDLRRPAEQPTGRGLAIVQAVMDTVSFVEADGHRFIRCTKHARTGPTETTTTSNPSTDTEDTRS